MGHSVTSTDLANEVLSFIPLHGTRVNSRYTCQRTFIQSPEEKKSLQCADFHEIWTNTDQHYVHICYKLKSEISCGKYGYTNSLTPQQTVALTAQVFTKSKQPNKIFIHISCIHFVFQIQ